MSKKGKPQLLFLLLITSLLNNVTINVNAGAHSNFCPIVLFSKLPQYDKSTTFLRDFFIWYKTKFNYLDHHIYFVDMDLKGTNPYRVNFTKTEVYLSILKSSGYFSENYIQNARAYFKQIDLTLQKTKQNDGTVDGLDYDLIIHSQEPESMLADLAGIQLSVVNASEEKEIVKMKTKFNVNTYSLYYLIKNNNKFKIDKIDFINGD